MNRASLVVSAAAALVLASGPSAAFALNRHDDGVGRHTSHGAVASARSAGDDHRARHLEPGDDRGAAHHARHRGHDADHRGHRGDHHGGHGSDD